MVKSGSKSKNTPTDVSPSSESADANDLANINRLSLNYGAEYYSMVDIEEQKEIAQRNSEMRDKVKVFRKSKGDTKKERELPGSYINISNGKKSVKSKIKSKDDKTLREILRLHKLHNMLKNTRIPFIVLLDVELNRLLSWLAPTPEEKIAKEQVLLQLEVVVNALFPDGNLKVFGSYVTGLSLPGADIDVCIQSEGDQLCVLNMIVYTLNRLGLVHSFECIYNTAVPVVKLVDKRTGVRIDLSCYNESAFKTTKFIQEMCVKYKYMQPLILLVKLFLQSRNLGDTYFGGVGSFLLYCMILSFLQLHDSSSQKQSDDTNSLATLFIDFFYYWGFLRDYSQFVTTVRGLGHVYPRKLKKEQSDSMLSCDNPIDHTVDLGTNSFNMHSVNSAFQNAFIILKNIEHNIRKWFPNKVVTFGMNFSTILESLYDVSHPVFQKRSHESHENVRKDYFNDHSNTLNASLDSVLKHLKKSLESSRTNTFNAQRQLMESLSSEQNELNLDGDIPFYIVAEAVGKETSSLL
ncbi:topoisomerase-related nucleotidyltransferase [Theileria orientalis strain Shintoku]|uniref:Topoisomerase-related nucleotidyltransferase n=1 Tax=Theileria orientalis strain Shintoku TaxID=869250 RepID=J4D784_THEOR|nr:topoisomerase-related nucleotidyltransferase [Theileria orientalis strain Shintoku]BAM40025.1 topoisomerase-related nucleotidyltransferase [Theileria orientalis strain Shintoku]|eukprot:XP_009690326.1 topoisomerase-related nucleotidyltransferase [Theileria orientalis strain Shintoku]